MSEEGSKKCQRVKFLCNQLEMNSNDPQNYSSDTMREAMSIFLRGRGAYEAVRELLIFSHKRLSSDFLENWELEEVLMSARLSLDSF